MKDIFQEIRLLRLPLDETGDSTVARLAVKGEVGEACNRHVTKQAVNSAPMKPEINVFFLSKNFYIYNCYRIVKILVCFFIIIAVNFNAVGRPFPSILVELSSDYFISNKF